jgi:hypothetical protein
VYSLISIAADDPAAVSRDEYIFSRDVKVRYTFQDGAEDILDACKTRLCKGEQKHFSGSRSRAAPKSFSAILANCGMSSSASRHEEKIGHRHCAPP